MSRTERRVVVTGGSSGVGLSIVRYFAQRGFSVFFTYYRNENSALKLSSEFSSVSFTQLDQGDFFSIQRFISAIERWCEGAKIDVLINNAALGSATVKNYVSSDQSFISKSTSSPRVNNHVFLNAMEDLAMMRVNALGPLWITEGLLPLMYTETVVNNAEMVFEAGSTSAAPALRTVVVFIGSVGGGSSGVFPEYRAADLMSKAAVTYLAKHMAAEHIYDSLDIFCLSPGAINTEMFRLSTLSSLSNPEEFIQAMPKSSLIQTEEIAQSVYWLATNPCSRIFHGANLDASLGLATRPGLQTESRRH